MTCRYKALFFANLNELKQLGVNGDRMFACCMIDLHKLGIGVICTKPLVIDVKEFKDIVK